jgi:hypothetical protein
MEIDNMQNSINTKDMIDAFKLSLEENDPIKARVILSYIEEVDNKTQYRLLFELVRSDVSFHLPLLMYLMDQHHTFCRQYEIIEETLISYAFDYPDIFADALHSDMIKNPQILIEIVEKAETIKNETL